MTCRLERRRARLQSLGRPSGRSWPLALSVLSIASGWGCGEGNRTPPDSTAAGSGGLAAGGASLGAGGGSALGGAPTAGRAGAGASSSGRGGTSAAADGGATAASAGTFTQGAGAGGASAGSVSMSGGTAPFGGSSGGGNPPNGGAPSGGSAARAGAPGTGGATAAGGRGGASGGRAGAPSGGQAGAAGGSAGSGTAIDVTKVTASCPGAVPGGVTSTWCSCDQWAEKASGSYTYYNDIWGSGPGAQCIWLADSGAWGVTSAHPSTSGIKAYPNVSTSPNKVISSIQSYTSSFDIIVPSAATYDTAYDVWVKGSTSARIEIMLWMSYRGTQPIAKSYDSSGAVADATNVTVGGHTWNVYYGTNGSNDVASFVRTTNTSSGTVDIKAVLSWLITNNHSSYAAFTASYTLDQVQFGHEITTDSGAEAYVTRSFSVTSN